MPIYTLKVLKQGQKKRQQGDPYKAKNIYEFQARDIRAEIVYFDRAYKDKVVLFLNFAPSCSPAIKDGFKELEDGYVAREEKAFAIGAFLCYQFKATEPNCQRDLRSFYRRNKINFECFAPINVNEPREHPLFTFLKLYNNKQFGAPIRGSYTKFLINRLGVPVKRYEPHIPLSVIFADVDRELARDPSATMGRSLSQSGLKSVTGGTMAAATKSMLGPKGTKSVLKANVSPSRDKLSSPKSATVHEASVQDTKDSPSSLKLSPQPSTESTPSVKLAPQPSKEAVVKTATQELSLTLKESHTVPKEATSHTIKETQQESKQTSKVSHGAAKEASMSVQDASQTVKKADAVGMDSSKKEAGSEPVAPASTDNQQPSGSGVDKDKDHKDHKDATPASPTSGGGTSQ